MEENNEEEANFDKAHMKDFSKVLLDFTNDILNTFPEQKETLDDNLNSIITNINNEEYDNTDNIASVRKHCATVYPEKFFDILYQNEEMFNTDVPLELLPGIDFNTLWKDESVSDNTRKTIWKQGSC